MIAPLPTVTVTVECCGGDVLATVIVASSSTAAFPAASCAVTVSRWGPSATPVVGTSRLAAPTSGHPSPAGSPGSSTHVPSPKRAAATWRPSIAAVARLRPRPASLAHTERCIVPEA